MYDPNVTLSMGQGRDDAGRDEQSVTKQDILKVFDYENDPVLTAPAVANGLRRFGVQITPEGVRNRLNTMDETGLVSRKKVGSKAVAWWATVAPEIDAAVADTIDSRKASNEWTEL